MRRIERTNAFRRDFKREKRGQHRRDLDDLLAFAVSLLADDKPLPERIAITPWPANGLTTANVTSSPTYCLFIAKKTRMFCNWSASVRIASFLISHVRKYKCKLASHEICRVRGLDGPSYAASARTAKIEIPYG